MILQYSALHVIVERFIDWSVIHNSNDVIANLMSQVLEPIIKHFREQNLKCLDNFKEEAKPYKSTVQDYIYLNYFFPSYHLFCCNVMKCLNFIRKTSINLFFKTLCYCLLWKVICCGKKSHVTKLY